MFKNHKIMMMVLFGAIWGLLEAVLGGPMHFLRIPFTGTIMASAGFAVLFAASRAGLGIGYLLAMGAFAALFKFIDPFILPVSIADPTVINPAVAIASQTLAFGAVFGIKRVSESYKTMFAGFLISAAVAMLAFNLISMAAFGWETTHMEAPLMAIFVKIPLTALIATILVKTGRFVSAEKFLLLPAPYKWAAAATSAILAVIVRFVS